jgi:hypothetical protein
VCPSEQHERLFGRETVLTDKVAIVLGGLDVRGQEIVRVARNGVQESHARRIHGGVRQISKVERDKVPCAANQR